MHSEFFYTIKNNRICCAEKDRKSGARERGETMKKIVILLGGGRPRGNTAQLAEAFAKGAQAAGHQVEILPLRQYKVHGCIGCNACRYGKPFIHPAAKGDFFIFCILHTFDGVVQSVSQQRSQIDIGH